MNSERRHTVIIGGGIIGACCAWYLQKAGRKVTIIDKGEFGAGCSHGNCGYVSPSHVFPLPSPGQISNGLRGMFNRQSALRIRPGLSLSLWRWLFGFARKCNQKDMMTGGKARHALLQSSRALYEDLIQTENLQVDWQTDGLLFVFRDQREFDHFEATDRALRQEFGVGAEPMDGVQLTRLEPALKPGLAGAWHYQNDAHLRPDRLMSELKRRLTESGVAILSNHDMQTFAASGDRATAVETATETLSADEFVVATGPLTPMLNRELGCRLPIQPGKGYSITMARPEKCPKFPMLLEEAHVGITPFEDGYRIGSTMEFSGYNTQLNRERLNYLRSGAAEYLVEPTAEPVYEEWFGWRPMTCDGVAYIDRTPRFRNVWVAAGHNMLGLSMGTATGRLVSELVTEARPHIDPHPYRIGRK